MDKIVRFNILGWVTTSWTCSKYIFFSRIPTHHASMEMVVWILYFYHIKWCGSERFSTVSGSFKLKKSGSDLNLRGEILVFFSTVLFWSFFPGILLPPVSSAAPGPYCYRYRSDWEKMENIYFWIQRYGFKHLIILYFRLFLNIALLPVGISCTTGLRVLLWDTYISTMIFLTL